MIQLLPPELSFSNDASGCSVWRLTSESDFNQGTFKNITITGVGDEASLEIDASGSVKWTDISPSYCPEARARHALASIFGTEEVLMFGGYTRPGSVSYQLDDTWTFNISTNSWTNRSTTPNPGKRQRHAMASIYGYDRVVLFGGYLNDEVGDTWVYDLSENKWSAKATGPPKRNWHAMAPIYGHDRALLFGGSDGGVGAYNDTWVYDLSLNSWSKKSPTFKPGGAILNKRNQHGMASVWGTDKVVLFGGIEDPYKYVNDTWVYDLSDNEWTKKFPKGSQPVPLSKHAMATIYNTDKVLLFSGYDDWNSLNETWVYDLSDNIWTQYYPPNKPSIRFFSATAGVYETNKVVLFGGSGFGYQNDTWVFECTSDMKNGTYISKQYDTGMNPLFKNITWDSIIPVSTSIKFQIRTAQSQQDLITNKFVGPNGYISSYYTASPADIWSGHNYHRWIQFKAIFNTSFKSSTPCLEDVIIYYNCLPNIQLISPANGSLINNSKPTFRWNFLDSDSTEQAAYQVLIDDELSFTDVLFDSDEQNSKTTQWDFPNGTSYDNLPEGTWYWKARTKDEDGDWSEFSQTFELIIDSKPPVDTITFPVNNEYYNDLDEITGTCDDNLGSGINKVELTILRLSDDYYWQESYWAPFQNWLRASGSEDWAYDTSLVSWTSGTEYYVESRAWDKAENIGFSSNGISFHIDNAMPKSIIDFPVDDSFLNEVNKITGSSTDIDGSGVQAVEINIERVNDNYYWTGMTWGSYMVWLPVEGIENWSFDSSKVDWTSDLEYIIYARAKDNVNNIEELPYEVSFLFDNKAPEDVEILINNDEEYTSTESVILSMQAIDTGSGLGAVAYSTDGEIWSAWEGFNTSKTHELIDADGENWIYFKVQDRAGNIGETVHDTIILDTTPPYSLSILINNGAVETNSTFVTLQLNAIDNLSGVYQMSFSLSGTSWTKWEEFKNEKTYQLSSGDGEKTIHFRVRDQLGNAAQPITSTILLNTSKPQIKDPEVPEEEEVTVQEKSKDDLNLMIISLIIVIVLFLILIVFFFIYRKKQKQQILPGKMALTIKPRKSSAQFPATRQPQMQGYKGQVPGLFRRGDVQPIPPPMVGTIGPTTQPYIPHPAPPKALTPTIPPEQLPPVYPEPTPYHGTGPDSHTLDGFTYTKPLLPASEEPKETKDEFEHESQ